MWRLPRNYLIFNIGDRLTRLEDVFFVFVAVLVACRRLLELREEHFADLPLLQRVVLLQDFLVQPVRVANAWNGVGNALK